MGLEKSILKDLKAQGQNRTADSALWWCLFYVSLYTCLLSLSDHDLFELGNQEIYPFIQLLNKCVRCSGYCARCWGYKDGHDTHLFRIRLSSNESVFIIELLTVTSVFKLNGFPRTHLKLGMNLETCQDPGVPFGLYSLECTAFRSS